MKVNLDDFKRDIDHYLVISNDEDVEICVNDTTIAILTNPKEKAFRAFMALKGCLSEFDDGRDYKEILIDELMKKHGY